MAQLFWLTIFLICNLAYAQLAGADPWSGRRLYAGDAYVSGDFSAQNFFGNVSGATITDVSNQIPQDDLEYILGDLWYRMGIAYDWGNHALAGYLKSYDPNDSVQPSELDGTFNTTGLLKRLGTANYTTVADNSANWDQAFGWGDHAQAGYLKTYNPNDSVDASELEVLFGPLGAGLMIREASGDFKTTPNNHRQWDTAYNNIIQYASNWQTAFSERRQWDGSAINLDAPTGRNSLGLGSAALSLATDFAGAAHNHGTGTVGKLTRWNVGASGTIMDATLKESASSLVVGENLNLQSQYLHKLVYVGLPPASGVYVCYLKFPSSTLVHGLIKLRLMGSYNSNAATGNLEYHIAFGGKYDGSLIWRNDRRCVQSEGYTSTYFAAGDMVWNATESRYVIPIYNRGSRNELLVDVEYISIPSLTDAYEITISPWETWGTQPPISYPSYMTRLGIKTTTPEYDLDVSGSARIVGSSLSTQPSHIATQTGSDNVLKWQTWGDFINNLSLSGEIGGGNIGGTGSAGYIAKFIASATLANSIFQDDGTNAGVGTGPVSNTKLNINGNVNIPSGSKYKIGGIDLAYSDVGAAAEVHNHGTGTAGKLPKWNDTAGGLGNSIIQDYSTYAVVRGSFTVENGLEGIISNESLLNNFISGEGWTGNNLILYSAKNRLALAHKKYSVSTNQTINIDSAFLPGDTYVNITSDKLPLTIEILGTFSNFSSPGVYRPFVFMHSGYFGSIKFEIRGANGTWYVVDDISNNASVWWVGSTNSVPSIPFSGVRFTFNNASGSPVYLRELGFFHPRSEPWTQYIMAQGDSIFGTLNFSGVDSDIITPAGEHFSIMSGGNIGIKTTNPAYDLDVNGVVRMNKLVGIGADNSYGTISFKGTKNGFAGINFRNASDLNLGSFLLTTQYGGVFNSADTAWVWRFNNGVLDVGSIASAQQIMDITTYVDNEVDRLLVANNAISLSYTGAGNTLSISARYDNSTIKTNIDNQLYVNPGEIPFSGLRGVSVGGVTDNQILKYIAGSWIAAATAADDDSLKTVDWDNFVDRTNHHIDINAKELGGVYVLDGYSTNDMIIRADGKLRFFDDSPVGTPYGGSFGGEYYNGNYQGQWWNIDGDKKYEWRLGAANVMILSATDLNLQNRNISSANDIVANGAVFAKNRHYAWNGSSWEGGVSSGGDYKVVTNLRWNGTTLQHKYRTHKVVNGIVVALVAESNWENVP